ncbi:cytochrome C [Ramlibacter rhizophilus]|uniref:cytochrome C n=1 Tax=Ramlibacter rhizophilus TaxID=1781167 RepID=UPI00197CC9BD|nr:cytochrome C [Ramlibacter rhizophilus]
MQAIPRPALIFAAALLLAPPVSAQVPDRGRLLYETHCIECHTTQMHWRDQRLAQDWDSLRAQVQRWQGTARLQWSEADIDEVTRHLNETIYQFPRARAGAPRTTPFGLGSLLVESVHSTRPRPR